MLHGTLSDTKQTDGQNKGNSNKPTLQPPLFSTPIMPVAAPLAYAVHACRMEAPADAPFLDAKSFVYKREIEQCYAAERLIEVRVLHAICFHCHDVEIVRTDDICIV